ncbi:hypothetical protein GN155_014455 [Alcanivorax sp. ZXX171]|nr:hypothetical protein [Alcanivorax sp. ZXX171]
MGHLTGIEASARLEVVGFSPHETDQRGGHGEQLRHQLYDAIEFPFRWRPKDPIIGKRGQALSFITRMDRHLPVSRLRSPITDECLSKEACASLPAENSVDVLRGPAILLFYSTETVQGTLRAQNKKGFI